MMKKLILLFLFVLIFNQLSLAQLNKKATKALIKRIIPNETYQFKIDYIPKDGNKDVFEIKSSNGKIILSGNNGVSIASALNYYLKNYCHSSISWDGSNIHLPDKLPAIDGVIRKISPYKYRYYLNYCTFNYTMSWWHWKQWQKEIDWMAMNGINMPLALTGQNYVWYKLYRKMGFTNEQLQKFFSGPAFFAWFWMNNLDGWGGPLPLDWMKAHEALQKKILKQERALGMDPILPAFSGHVPQSFKKIYPYAKVNYVQWIWPFKKVEILNPKDSLFSVIGKQFLQLETHIYGASHYYSTDLFNEVTPPTKDPSYLSNISHNVYKSMIDVDPKSVWVMQAWLFLNKSYWQPTQVKALLNAVPDNHMAILDLDSSKRPIWNTTRAYYGKPWIWNLLNNFGGNNTIFGNMESVAKTPAQLLHNPKDGDLKGIGLTMESSHQNPAIYQLLLSNTWRNKPINLDQWLKNYTTSRYGQFNQNAYQAWKLIASSIYKDKQPVGASKSIIALSPSLNYNTQLYYDPQKLAEAWKQLISCSVEFRNIDSFQYDLVNITRQVLSNYGSNLYRQIQTAYRKNDIPEFQHSSRKFLQLITDMNRLLGTRKEFLLGRWLNNARSWGNTKSEKDLYEFNARDLITIWGPKVTEPKGYVLNGYVSHQWNGLLDGYYKPRWKKFFDYAVQCMRNNQKVNMKYFYPLIVNWEWKWVHEHNQYRNQPEGNPVKVSNDLYKKYFTQIMQKSNP